MNALDIRCPYLPREAVSRLMSPMLRPYALSTGPHCKEMHNQSAAAITWHTGP